MSIFFVGAQTVISLLQTTQIISDICFITDHIAYTSWNKTKIICMETTLFFSLFFNQGWTHLMFTHISCLHLMFARLLLQSYQNPNLSEGTDHVSGQPCGDKECHFSGITKSGRVQRKVPKSDAQSVEHIFLYVIYTYTYFPATVGNFFR